MDAADVPTTPIAGVSVGEAGERMVASLEARGRKASALAAHESALRAHLIPFFGDRPVGRIEPADVEAFIASRRGSLAPKSIRNYLGTLHSVLEFARVRPNPVTDAHRPEADGADPDICFLTEPQVEALLGAVPGDHLGPTNRVLFMTAAFTGLRQGELFGLRWRDVDWRARCGSGCGAPTRARELAARRGSEDRSRGARRARCRCTTGSAPSWSATTSARPTAGMTTSCSAIRTPGGPLDSSNVLDRLRAALDAAGVRRITFHDLRHTFETRMAAAGVPMRTLQEWMDHRDIKTTRIYADYAPSDHERAMIERAISRGPARGPEPSEGRAAAA